jgi:Tol biopolymer transport system component
MGEVYKAKDTRLDRVVAIKVLPPSQVSDPERKRRFVQEAKAASALNHPNIVAIYDIATDGGVDFIVMEYVAGQTLDQRIGRNGLRISSALQWAGAMADALAAAHAAGILHRDLKPANVMIADTGQVKLLDFGLAKLADPSETTEQDETRTIQTQDGSIVGTIAYMSPEQAEGKKLDFRSDIFSFGAVLYEMVTGQRAFTGDSTASTLSSILRDDPKPVVSLRPDVPRDVERLIARCLRKDPSRRVQTAGDLKAVLEDLREDLDSGKTEFTAAPVQRRRASWKIAAAAIFLAAAVASFLRFRAPQPEVPLTAVPLTGNPGIEYDASFSPDGNQVAYVWNGEKQDNTDIYVKLIGGGAPLRLTTNPAPDYSPAWSPDGRTIAFVRRLGGHLLILSVPALGGTERQLAEIRQVGPGIIRYLCWSPDSKNLIIADRSPGEPGGLFVLSVASGEKRRLTTIPDAGETADFSQSLSPDGRKLAFARALNTLNFDLYTLDLNADLTPAGRERRFTFDNQRAANPAWSPSGREVVYSNAIGIGGATAGLMRVPDSGSVGASKLAGVGEEGNLPAISAQAHRLIYTRHFIDQNVWKFETSGGNTAPSLVVGSSRRDLEPRLSPDGSRLAFTSDRTGSSQVWIASADGSGAFQLTSMRGSVNSAARWSPDGQRIVFLSNEVGQSEIYSIGVNGGKPTRLTNHPAQDTAPSWSGDGKSIYFASNRSGDYQVWKMPTTGGEPVQITRNGGYAALESPDGKFLYYSKRRTSDGVWRLSTSGGEETKIVDAIDSWGNFAVADQGIYFVPAAADSIQRYDFSSGKVTTVVRTEKPLDFGLAVTQDGGVIYYTQMDHERSELLLVENFQPD